ncbi:MAG: hypothetical protein GKR90_21815 [Pseudomonadales bacterium]|nr:hypothetical protein [Pseudomonadales bacterium]
MPGDISEGWYLQICPDGLTSTEVMVLTGDEHHHHHGHDDARLIDCELGGGFAAALDLAEFSDSTEIFARVLPQASERSAKTQTRPVLQLRARAPPHFRST